MSLNDNLNFDLPKNQSSVIKVIGVGGGGSNAVNHMYSLGIKGVDFVISNTDAQALENSPIPNKVQLGVTLTEGLGAGANPEVGQEAATESLEDIKALLNTNTKMVFITAGMGGGTGTGAAPVIAKTAKDMGILTVGIVTMPFSFEGANRLQQAEKGVDALRSSVDSLVVINNNKLREVYGNLGFKAGFAKADEVLATAARGIAEVITHHYTANIDLRDAKTVLSNSGTAIMGAANASGENRAHTAVSGALDSPLLNDNHIRGAKNVLLLIVSGQDEITIDEIGEINEYIQNEAGGKANIIMGIGENSDLGDEIAVTIVATGFNPDQQEQTIGRIPDKVVHTLEDDQAISSSVYQKPLSIDKEEDDLLIDLELDKVKKQRETSEKETLGNQASLFDLEKSVEEPLETKEDIQELDFELNLNQETTPVDPVETEENSENVYFSLEDPTEATEEELSEEEPIVFEVEEKEVEIHSETPVKKFSLEEYQELEQQLSEAKVEDINESDKDLQFEVKTKVEENSNKKELDINPMESTIAESMRLRAQERRAKLKAFNYRFKNNPNGFSEAANEPAYKRQGIDIDQKNFSDTNAQSRFTIDTDEDGANIRTNNSFLHDNVD